MTNKLFLNPEKIVVIEPRVTYPEKLREYLDLIRKNEFVHPVLVLKTKSETKQRLIERYLEGSKDYYFLTRRYGDFSTKSAIRIVEEDFSKLETKISGAEYYLVNGNHRSVAYALNDNPIFAIEPENNEDLEKLFGLVKSGRYPSFYYRAISFDDLQEGVELDCIDNLDNVENLKQKVERLKSKGILRGEVSLK